MDVAILGGTGDLGEGLALRWGADTDHTVIVGSRDAERGRDAADRYERRLDSYGHGATIEGTDNATATQQAAVVVAAVPAYHLADTVAGVADAFAAGAVLISPAVGMKHDGDGAHYNRPSAGSVAALAARAAPEDVHVAAAFHNLPAARLADLDRELAADVPVVGDETGAETAATLAEDIAGVGAVRAGPLANAAEIEGLTSLLINLGTYADIDDACVSFE
jgi:NADPH-dependent F420 reductase